jgi:hypothetical protein
MKPGDLLTIIPRTHSYPIGWVRGEEPHRYTSPTIVVFLEEFLEKSYGADNPRTFYRILTPAGEHNINSIFCHKVSS